MLVLVVALVSLSAACGGGDEDPEATSASKTTAAPKVADIPDVPKASGPAPKHVTVVMENSRNHPLVARVAVGGRVTWINRDAERHTAETWFTKKHGFDTHTLEQGESVTVTMRAPGWYPYFSSYGEPSMKAAIEVVPRR